MKEHLSQLVKSKRFWAAMLGLLAVILKGFYPDISDDQINNAIMLISAWIVGETVRPVLGVKPAAIMGQSLQPLRISAVQMTSGVPVFHLSDESKSLVVTKGGERIEGDELNRLTLWLNNDDEMQHELQCFASSPK